MEEQALSENIDASSHHVCPVVSMSARLYPDVLCRILVYSLNLAIVRVIIALKSPEYQYIEMTKLSPVMVYLNYVLHTEINGSG